MRTLSVAALIQRQAVRQRPTAEAAWRDVRSPQSWPGRKGLSHKSFRKRHTPAPTLILDSGPRPVRTDLCCFKHQAPSVIVYCVCPRKHRRPFPTQKAGPSAVLPFSSWSCSPHGVARPFPQLPGIWQCGQTVASSSALMMSGSPHTSCPCQPGGTEYLRAGLVIQSCQALCSLMDYSLSVSSVRGVLQARILEWVAMPSSRGSS